mmetsp:Transcript_25298/g.24203  ORF Transcript_25298/g.24203 Transcript_25298/m.24203 type:complete len:193 (+) Transcript_25298:91-669(+)|eukprot:CAMPEP_0119034476 /NCGR_PEP_ID=MMETSP1177-20130426/1465_1 /TAXON_ID=2985 /ORGANISM="Ochromonas sp, Strain CCMP1899" /LENGTH=192 /DNA_ID=CAMNT_0006991933 /DNA_START=79 /DNA_END=657 /DNA_ORIENTATION=-
MSQQQQKGGNQRLGETVWNRMPRVNAELFTLTYGSMVMQLIKDYDDVAAVNQQLEKMGRNIGCRIIDEFLSKSGVSNCSNFKDTADVIAKVAFKMFLGINCDVINWNSENTVCSLVFSENPFVDFVELPPQYSDLQYCSLLCGVIIGALEMVQMSVDCRFVRDVLKGDNTNELRVELKGMVANVMSDEYKET